ncbi:MAG: MFS transporter, partial [Anaerolineaceae bacterium]|nr:MFS transporter [Anaerolineaceae bacterium]
LSNRFGALKLLVMSEALAIVSLIIISQAQSLAYFIAAAILVGLGEAVNQPILLSECVSSAAPSEHGRASNTNYIGIDIGNFIGSNLSGILVAVIGYRSMFLMAILPVLIATGFYLYIKRKQHGDRIGVKKQIGASESVCRRIREGESST